MLTKWLKISLPVLFSLFLFVLFIFPISVQAKPPEGKVPENVIAVEPVNGINVGPGKKLWVFAFPARGGKPGPPDGRGGSDDTECSGPCIEDSDTLGFNTLGFTIPSTGLEDININDSSIPIEPNIAINAIESSFGTWNKANKKLDLIVNAFGGANGPDDDGNHTVGWVRIVPKNTLAATWVWTRKENGKDVVDDVDIFFNLFHKWEDLAGCGGSKFDIEGICTHEVGHLIGLGHFSDSCKKVTMYPSAPKGEIIKRKLTQGDINGAGAVTPD